MSKGGKMKEKSDAEKQVGYLKYLLGQARKNPEQADPAVLQMLEATKKIWADGEQVFAQSKSGETLSIDINKLL